MTSVERHLNNVFSNAANERAKKQIGKKFHYVLYKNAFRGSVVSEGTCEVTGRYYDSYEDCDMISIIDVDTKERYHTNQFAIDLTEEVN